MRRHHKHRSHQPKRTHPRCKAMHLLRLENYRRRIYNRLHMLANHRLKKMNSMVCRSELDPHPMSSPLQIVHLLLNCNPYMKQFCCATDDITPGLLINTTMKNTARLIWPIMRSRLTNNRGGEATRLSTSSDRILQINPRTGTRDRDENTYLYASTKPYCDCQFAHMSRSRK